MALECIHTGHGRIYGPLQPLVATKTPLRASTGTRISKPSWLKKSRKETDDKRQTSTYPPSDIFVPEKYLVADLPQARILTYGYNADVIRGLFQANNLNSVFTAWPGLRRQVGEGY